MIDLDISVVVALLTPEERSPLAQAAELLQDPALGLGPPLPWA